MRYMRMRGMYERLGAFMINAGFEEMTLHGGDVFYKDGKFVRIECGEKYAAVELAHGRDEADGNMYDDIGFYDYTYMHEHGFPGNDDILEEICADIVRYAINQ